MVDKLSLAPVPPAPWVNLRDGTPTAVFYRFIVNLLGMTNSQAEIITLSPFNGFGLDTDTGDDEGFPIPGPRGLAGLAGLPGVPGSDGEDGQDAFSILQPPPNSQVGLSINGFVATTDATVTTIATIPVPSNYSMTVECLVTARRTGGSSGSTGDSSGFVLAAIVKNIAGTATVVGSSLTFSAGDQMAWTVTASASGAKLLVQVAGAANNTIDWIIAGSMTQIG